MLRSKILGLLRIWSALMVVREKSEMALGTLVGVVAFVAAFEASDLFQRTLHSHRGRLLGIEIWILIVEAEKLWGIRAHRVGHSWEARRRHPTVLVVLLTLHFLLQMMIVGIPLFHHLELLHFHLVLFQVGFALLWREF
jgi:hypothetical protein